MKMDIPAGIPGLIDIQPTFMPNREPPVAGGDTIHRSIEILQKDVATIPLHQQVIVWAAKQNIELAQPADNSFQYRFVQVK